MAEELALEQGFGEGPASHGHDGRVTAPAVGVHRPRDELFASSALPSNHDGGVGRSEGPYQIDDLQNRRTLADNGVEMTELVDGLAQLPVLVLEAALGEGALDQVVLRTNTRNRPNE